LKRRRIILIGLYNNKMCCEENCKVHPRSCSVAQLVLTDAELSLHFIIIIIIIIICKNNPNANPSSVTLLTTYDVDFVVSFLVCFHIHK